MSTQPANNQQLIKSPFPFFGGKSRVAHIVWERFGNPTNYVEPFAGSLAVLLRRPHAPRIETVNDIDCYISNFWRAIHHDPEQVAHWADWPVNEADLHARHLWLVQQADFREKMKTDPEFYDPKLAGWWVWGISCWIGGGWCATEYSRKSGLKKEGGVVERRPNLHNERGVNRKGRFKQDGTIRTETWRPDLSWERGIHNPEYGVPNKRPNLGGNADKGVHRPNLHQTRPCIDRGERGVQQFFNTPQRLPELFREKGVNRPAQQIPDLAGDGGAAGRGIHASGKRQSLAEYFGDLCMRLRRVRVCCGNWDRVLGPSVTWKIGTTGIFLDPPYSAAAGRDPDIYAQECLHVAEDVREWAIANGDNPKLRIALCGYEGEHDMPENWTQIAWKASGGYGGKSNGRGRQNANRERIWFSPYCLRPETEQLSIEYQQDMQQHG